MTSKPVLMYAATASISVLRFLRGQLEYIVNAGFEVHVVCGADTSGKLASFCEEQGAQLHEVDAERAPSPVRDFRTYCQVHAALRRVRPDILVAGTPKMSLIALLAARSRRVPHRIYLCHGLRFEGSTGLVRAVLEGSERLLARLATDIVAVSTSVRTGLTALGIPERQIVVLGSGSANGVDLTNMRPPTRTVRNRSRLDLEIPIGDTVVTFVGRLTRDKGLATLLQVAQTLAKRNESSDLTQTHLLIVGPSEPRGEEDRRLIERLNETTFTTVTGPREDLAPVYASSDLLILPTIREGLPTVILEANAHAIPVVAYQATGTVDAIDHCNTGIIVPPGDTRSFIGAVLHLIELKEERIQMGKNARAFVERHFLDESVWSHWEKYLTQKLAGRR